MAANVRNLSTVPPRQPTTWDYAAMLIGPDARWLLGGNSVNSRLGDIAIPLACHGHLGSTTLTQTNHRPTSILHERSGRIDHILFGAAADTITLHGNSFRGY